MYQWWCISVCHKFFGYSLIHRRPIGGPSTELWDFGSPPRATVPWHFMAFPSKIRCPVSGFPKERVSGRVCLTLRLRIEKSLVNTKKNVMACIFWTSSCIAMYRRGRSSSHRHQHIAFSLTWSMPEGTLISHSQSLIRTFDSKVIGWVSREKALDPLNFSDGQRPQTCGPQRAPPGILSPTGSVTLLRVSIGYRTKLDMTWYD